MGDPVAGGPILKAVRGHLEEQGRALAQKHKRVAVVLFRAPEDVAVEEAPAYSAAITSAREKVRNFTALVGNPRRLPSSPTEAQVLEWLEGVSRDESVTGVAMHVLEADASEQQFETLLTALNADDSVTGVIVQIPVPPDLMRHLSTIAPDKDIDALRAHPNVRESSPYEACATAEGIVRVVEPFIEAEGRTRVAVVGSEGFVGGGVARLLRRDARVVLTELDTRLGHHLDRETEIGMVRDADIVIATAPVPDLLDERHLTAQQLLVVDSAFIPQADGIHSCVTPTAREIPQHYTPVPGGTGPLEMAMLLERVIRKEVDPELPAWHCTRDARVVEWRPHQAAVAPAAVAPAPLGPLHQEIADLNALPNPAIEELERLSDLEKLAARGQSPAQEQAPPATAPSLDPPHRDGPRLDE